jgi:hypothetical protein
MVFRETIQYGDHGNGTVAIASIVKVISTAQLQYLGLADCSYWSARDQPTADWNGMVDTIASIVLRMDNFTSAITTKSSRNVFPGMSAWALGLGRWIDTTGVFRPSNAFI